jgi:hypothetical protein
VATEGAGWAERIVLGLTWVVLAAIGLLLGVIEVFLIPQRLFGGVHGLAALLALVGNALLVSFGGVATRSYVGAVVPMLTWIVAVFLAGLVRPGGDVIIPGRIPTDPAVVWVGQAVLLLGIFGCAFGLVATAYFTARSNAPKPQG